jgi:hypothetical protein
MGQNLVKEKYMSHIDALVNDESKRSIIGARVAKLAQEGYQIALNLKFAQQEGKEEDTKKFEEAVAAVEASLAFHMAELALLKEEAPSTIEE